MKAYKIIFQLSISISLIYFIFNQKLDFSLFIDLFSKIRIIDISLILFLNLVSFYLLSMRSIIVFNLENNQKKNHHKIFFKSIFFNFFAPSNLGSDIYRLYSYKNNFQSFQIIKLLIWEKIFAFIYLIIFCFFSVLLINKSIVISFLQNFAMYIILIILLLMTIIYILYKNFVLLFNKIMIQINPFINYHFPIYTLTSFIIWTIGIFWINKILNLDASFFEIIVFAVITEIVRIIPISFQGIGLRELTFSSIALIFNYDFATAFYVSTYSYIMLSISLIACYPVSYLFKANNE